MGTTDMSSVTTVTIYGAATASGGQFGASVCLGKSVSGKSVNNDGFGDILIGAPELNSKVGRAYLIWGQATFGSSVTSISLPPSSSSVGISFTHPTSSPCSLGYAVSIGGDINGDGYLDLAIGAPRCNSDTGKAFIIFGASSLSDINLSTVTGNSWGFKVTGEALDSFTGCAVAINGDINNDGKADIVISACKYSNNRGKVYIIWGKSGSFADIDFSSANWNSNGEGIFIRGESGGLAVATSFGISLAVGDITRDDKADLLIGAHNYNDDLGQGKAYLLFGSALTATITNVASITLTQGFAMIGPDNSLFGKAVSIGGDVNFDGYNDLIVCGYAYSVSRGICYLVFGTTSTSLGNWDFSSPSSPPTSQVITIIGAYPNDQMGMAVAISGDSNHDSRADIILGAPGRGSGDGTTYIIYGKSSMTNYNLASTIPSVTPSRGPTRAPSFHPTSQPTGQPSVFISSQSLKDGLIAYYPFDGDANDKSGNGNNGMVYDGVIFDADRKGNVNGAFCFDGSETSYIEVLHGSSFNFPRDMTVAFWISPSSTQPAWSRIIDKSPFETSFLPTGWSIEHASNWKNIYRYRFYDEPDRYRATGNFTFLPNTWQHVTIVKTSSIIDFYRDGVLLSTTNVDPYSKITSSGNYPLTIGARLRGQAIPAQSVVHSFVGCLDDIFIYNRSILASEVTQLTTFRSPTALPTKKPSRQPTGQPSEQPTSQPSRQPSRQPTGQPSEQPTSQP
jgi:hypothetical protein